jgi:carbon-monoxide dehydrogenase small subunit
MSEMIVNGRTHEVAVAGWESLARVLRDQLHLIGVRVSCAEGECGSCTVLVDGQQKTSCLMLAGQAAGHEITTIEGLGTPDSLHPIQEAFIEEQGMQCGFCTPGFIMSAKAFLDENPEPTAEETAVAMSGNICRCGSYPYIVKSVQCAARKLGCRHPEENA